MRLFASHTSSEVTPTMLWKAAEKQDSVLVKKLIIQSHSTTANVSIVDTFHPQKGTTPLMIACKKRDKVQHNASASDVVEILLQFGANMALRSKTPDGNTAMHFAAATNQTRSIQYMLNAGVDAFALNAMGHAPIDIARWHNNREVVDQLTRVACVKSGTLYIKKVSQHGLRRWKKRFCVVLACNSARTLLELSIYKDPADVRPCGVVLLRVGNHSMLNQPKKRWTDRENMFRMDRPMVVQDMRAKRRFSRTDEMHQKYIEAGEAQLFEFATESPEMRASWMELLGRGTVTNGTTDRMVQHIVVPVSARFPSPPPLSNTSTSNAEEYTTLFPPPPPMQPISPTTGYGYSSQSRPTRSITSSASDSEEVLFPPSSSMSSTGDHEPLFGIPVTSAVFPLEDQQQVVPSAPPMDNDSFILPALNIRLPTDAVADHSRPVVADRSECVICMDASKDAICIPCGHIAGCYACLHRHVESDRICPICRASVSTVVKIYEC